MISRKNRFWGSKDIEHIYRRGKTVRADMLSLKFVPAKNPEYRLAVVVSRKVSKSAVVRNRIRRRLFEQVRLAHKNGRELKNDMVLSVFDDSPAKMPAEQLRQICVSLLNKADKL